jgi:hypothetical protein
MKASKELIEFVEDLRSEAGDVRDTTFQDYRGQKHVDAAKLKRLLASCRLLVAKLGPFGRVWDQMLQPPANNRAVHFEEISGVLDAIGNALAKGRLSTIEELVSTEVLGDLLEHAEELLKSKFNLAAGVILRAVLEERLRKLCEMHGCSPAAQRPTIETFKQSLFAAKIIDKIVVKDIDWMAGVGNSAAHHLAEYKDDDVPQFYQRLTAFLTRFSVT